MAPESSQEEDSMRAAEPFPAFPALDAEDSELTQGDLNSFDLEDLPVSGFYGVQISLHDLARLGVG